MRRFSFMLVLMLLLAACMSSPKQKAADWASRFPAEIAGFERNERQLLELTAENQSNYGHITMIYEGDDDYLAYITVDVFATSTAANVELGTRMRDWTLRGVRFSRERIAGEAFDVAMPPGGYLAFFQVRESIITLAITPPLENEEEDEDVADGTLLPLPPAEEIEIFLETIVAVSKNR